jgi:GH43 family beta-xylosidase
MTVAHSITIDCLGSADDVDGCRRNRSRALRNLTRSQEMIFIIGKGYANAAAAMIQLMSSLERRRSASTLGG